MSDKKLNKNMYLKDIVEMVISKEIAGLEDLRNHFDLLPFSDLVERIAFTTGKVIITGIGKSGIIARKIVASLCSIGISSVFLSHGDAAHGDMGVIAQNDVVVMLSNSGAGRELKKIICYCNAIKVCIVGISRDSESYLMRHSDISIILPNTSEVSDLAIPTTSSTIMLVFGDVLTIALKEKIQLKSEKYALYHPGGKIGLMYMKIKNLMIKGSDLPIVSGKTALIDVMITIGLKKLGFAIVVNDDSTILGIATAEAAKNLGKTQGIASDLINNSYQIVSGEMSVEEALINLNQYDQLIVVKDSKPEGLFTSEIFKSKVKL